MGIFESKKSKSNSIFVTVYYLVHVVVRQSNIKKTTDNIPDLSFNIFKLLEEKTFTGSYCIQIIEQSVKIISKTHKFKLVLREVIAIPFYALRSFSVNEEFKMISTIFKSGLEISA